MTHSSVFVCDLQVRNQALRLRVESNDVDDDWRWRVYISSGHLISEGSMQFDAIETGGASVFPTGA